MKHAILILSMLTLAIVSEARTAQSVYSLRPLFHMHEKVSSKLRCMRLRGGMMIYKDIVSGDEMMTDSFPSSLVDDVVYKIQTRMVVKDAVSVNIGSNPATDVTEDNDEGVEDQAVKVNDFVDAFRLQSLGAFDKKGVLAWLKGYLKEIKDHLNTVNPGRVTTFQESSSKWCKDVLLKNPADFEFFSGPSFNSDGGLAMMTYEGENPYPVIYLFKDGLIEEKC